MVVLQPHAVVAPDYCGPADGAAGVYLGTALLGCSWVAFGACGVLVVGLAFWEGGERTEPVLRGRGGGEEAALGGRADWDGRLAVPLHHGGRGAYLSARKRRFAQLSEITTASCAAGRGESLAAVSSGMFRVAGGGLNPRCGSARESLFLTRFLQTRESMID